VGLSACNNSESNIKVVNEEMVTYQDFIVTSKLEFWIAQNSEIPENLSAQEKVEERYNRTFGKYEGYYAGLPAGSKIKVLFIQDDCYAKILILETKSPNEWFENNKEVWTAKESLYDKLYTVSNTTQGDGSIVLMNNLLKCSITNVGTARIVAPHG